MTERSSVGQNLAASILSITNDLVSKNELEASVNVLLEQFVGPSQESRHSSVMPQFSEVSTEIRL